MSSSTQSSSVATSGAVTSVASTSIEVKVVTAAPTIITLAGRVAIVTGASRGIGVGIALRLARDGAKVVVNYNNDIKSANAVVAAINSIVAGSSIAVQGDISKSVDVERLFAEAKRVFGRVDIVVANSGIGSYAPIANTSDDDFNRVFGTNVNGTFYTLRAAANNISDNGRIIVIGSLTRQGLMPGMGPYAATKAAIEVLSITLAQELGSRGITVNTVHPGPTDTDMMMQAPAIMIEACKKSTPFGRLGTIADIGDAVALVASESARWISGQSIYATGAAKPSPF